MTLVVSLSSAWQRTLTFNDFIPDKVNRAKSVNETASGKGVNVARVASILGVKVTLLTVAGGARGRLLSARLKRERFGATVVPVEAETRICQTLITGDSATELVEEAGSLRLSEVQKVLRAFRTHLRKARLLILTGTVPPGCGDDFYARLAKEAGRCGVPVLIDAQREQLLNAMTTRPLLVKINRDELAAATRMNCHQPFGVAQAIRRLLKHGPQYAVITDGSKNVYIGESHERDVLVTKPPLVRTRNPIGSGDAMMAGIAASLISERTVLEAVQYGIACGAANAMTDDPGCLRRSGAERLFSTRNKRVLIV